MLAGNINGDLVLYGRGAPDLVSSTTTDNGNSLEALAQMLVERGVKRVRGNIVGDESYFRGQATGDGWQWNDLQWYYGAEASGLSIDGNQLRSALRQPLSLETNRRSQCVTLLTILK